MMPNKNPDRGAFEPGSALLISLFATFVVLIFAPNLSARSLDSASLALFPKEASELAYVDLDQARQFPWFAQFRRQMLPGRFREIEEFLVSARINPDADIQELAWAIAPVSAPKLGVPASHGSISEDFLGIVLGHFNPDSTQALLESRHAPYALAGDYTIYACGSPGDASGVYFVFLDAHTAAFGSRQMLDRLIAVRSGEEPSLLTSDTLLPLIHSVNDEGLFWGVADSSHARSAVRTLLPDAAGFRQIDALLTGLGPVSTLLKLENSSTLESQLHIVAGSAQDAVTLSLLLQAVLLLRQYRASQDDPILAAILGAVAIAPQGNQLGISSVLTNDQVLALIAQNVFALKL